MQDIRLQYLDFTVVADNSEIFHRYDAKISVLVSSVPSGKSFPRQLIPRDCILQRCAEALRVPRAKDLLPSVRPKAAQIYVAVLDLLYGLWHGRTSILGTQRSNCETSSISLEGKSGQAMTPSDRLAWHSDAALARIQPRTKADISYRSFRAVYRQGLLRTPRRVSSGMGWQCTHERGLSAGRRLL
jgi:hypothetical protein